MKRSWFLILVFTGFIAVPSSRAQQPGLIVRDTLGVTHLQHSMSDFWDAKWSRTLATR